MLEESAEQHVKQEKRMLPGIFVLISTCFLFLKYTFSCCSVQRDVLHNASITLWMRVIKSSKLGQSDLVSQTMVFILETGK